MKLSELFKKCVYRSYNHVENSADYSLERDGATLYIFFECSDDNEDWINNFNFPAKPYKRMGKTTWFAHRGFLKVWKTIEDYIKGYIQDESIEKIIIVGYSHGAALAVLCHEYVWYNRPDLRNSMEGYGFGCPRVFWGFRSKKLKQRWKRFKVIRNLDDIVTHVPPVIFGFSHMGEMLEIGERGKYSPVKAHRSDNYITELHTIESSQEWLL